MAATATFAPAKGTLAPSGDPLDPTIVPLREAAGKLPVQGGATAATHVFGQGGRDAIARDETIDALPRAPLSGGTGHGTLAGGPAGGQLFGRSDDGTLFGRGGADVPLGGPEDAVLTGTRSLGRWRW